MLSKFLKITKIIIIFISFFYINPNESALFRKESIIESNTYQSFNEIKQNSTDVNTSQILKEINIIKHISTPNTEIYKKRKNIIHITVSVNNNNDYKYILLVSMYSLLLNCNKRKTFIIYHLLCSPDFDEISINIYKSLVKHFSHNIEMIFYNMGNHFIKHRNTGWSQSSFYRILTPFFINSDRLIHLDGDTLIFTDLYEMYNLDFNDNYILGLYEINSNGLDYLGLNSSIYINAGVALLNLKKMRQGKKIFELIKMCNSDIKLTQVDQTAINYVLYPKIGRLPSKYGMFNFEDKNDLLVYHNLLRTKVPMNELEDALNNPGIIHFILCRPKPWFRNSTYNKDFTSCSKRKNCSCEKYFNLWHSFASKMDNYNEIVNFIGINKD